MLFTANSTVIFLSNSKACLKLSLILLRVSSLGRGRVYFPRWVRVSRLGWVGRHLIGRWWSLLDISPSRWIDILLGTLLPGACCDNHSGSASNRLCGSCNSVSTLRRYTAANDNADNDGDEHKERSWSSNSRPKSTAWRGYKEYS